METGRFGEHGGQYITETLMNELIKLEKEYEHYKNDPEFNAELDKLILDARSSTDQTYRKSMYKACLDKVIDWAVEIPVYQRQNAVIFSSERVNMDTVTPDITTFYGWLSEIEKVELK